MGHLINPATSRLGITRHWTVNYPKNLHGNYPISESYKLQSYLFCLQSFAHWVFAERFHRRFYLEVFVIYHQLKLNVSGFWGSHPRLRHSMGVVVSFFDFYSHVFYFNSFYSLAQNLSKLCRVRFKVSQLDVPINDLYAQSGLRKFYGFFYYYSKTYLTLKRLFKKYYSAFSVLLQQSKFKVGFVRIHRFFFSNFPVHCVFELKPYLGKVTAKFIAVYLERKVRTGTPVNRALKLMHKYLRKLTYVMGYRVICAGRFQRGKKAGFVSRKRGVFSFGRYHKSHLLDYATSTVDLKTGLCGFKIWLCYSPLIYDSSFIDQSGPVIQRTSKF